MAAEICFVTTCMGRLEHLKQTLPSLLSQPASSCILVDFSCPDAAGDWAQQNHPSVRVVKINGERTFHLSRARNAGARLVDTPWVCMIDADIIVSERFCSQMLPKLTEGHFYRGPLQGEGTIGTVICRTEDFRRCGGYDENMRGWGDEDTDLSDSLQFHGVQQAFIDSNLMRHIEHDNDKRVEHYDESCREQSLTVNRIYRLAKWDLARLHGKALTELQCERLYEIVKKRVITVWQDGGAEIRLETLPVDLKMGSWKLRRELVYHLSR